LTSQHGRGQVSVGKGDGAVATHWSELVFSGDAAPAVLSRAVQRGTLRRLASGVYTSLVDRDPEDVVSEHLWRILDHKLPGAVLVDRTAVRAAVTDGVVLVDHPRARPLVLPGVTPAITPFEQFAI